MQKTDGRHYNRQTNRDLSLEMDLWIKLQGKTTAFGSIADIKLERVGRTRRVQITFDSGECKPFLLKRRDVVGLVII
jgi:hypothetical protein